LPLLKDADWRWLGGLFVIYCCIGVIRILGAVYQIWIWSLKVGP